MSEEFNDLLAQIDPEDWLNDQGIDYKRSSSGQLQVKECPACGDSRWKVYLRADTGRGLCFHGDCGAKFNLFSFARQHLGTDAKGTIQHFESYASGLGIFRRVAKVERVAPSTEGWELPDNVALPTPEGDTHPYLVKRQITLETQERFDLRWCERGRYVYEDFEGRGRFMVFDGRILIPVADLDGTIKTFQGRDATETAEQRYLFPPMLPGTGRFVYGGHLVRDKEHLIVNEGPFDVWATHQAIQGFHEFSDTGVVGSFGLFIGSSDDNGDDQLARFRELKRGGLKRVTILWDGEIGAFKAALAEGMKLRGIGLRVFVGMLPADKDPNEVDSATVRRAILAATELTPASHLKLKLQPPYK